MRFRSFAMGIVLFLLGLVFGPVLLAVASGVAASSDDEARGPQAHDLMRAHDERYLPIRMHYIDFTGDIDDCGYEPERLFGSDFMAAGRDWNPYEGYFALFLWRSGEFRDQVERLRGDYLRRQYGPFAATFLDQCIRRTLFASLCGSRVGRALEAGGRLDIRSVPPGATIDQSREDRAICLYLDGVAARRGLPISSRREAPLRNPEAR